MKTATFLALALLSSASFASSSFAANRGFTCIEDKNWLGHLESGSKTGVILVAAPAAAEGGEYSVTASADGQTVVTMTGGDFAGSVGSICFSAKTQASGGSVVISVSSDTSFVSEDELQDGPKQEKFAFLVNKPGGSVPLFKTESLNMTCSLD